MALAAATPVAAVAARPALRTAAVLFAAQPVRHNSTLPIIQEYVRRTFTRRQAHLSRMHTAGAVQKLAGHDAPTSLDRFQPCPHAACGGSDEK
jgi:hypothetical protein